MSKTGPKLTHKLRRPFGFSVSPRTCTHPQLAYTRIHQPIKTPDPSQTSSNQKKHPTQDKTTNNPARPRSQRKSRTLKTAAADGELLRQGGAHDELRGQAAAGPSGHGVERRAEGGVESLGRQAGLRRSCAVGRADRLRKEKRRCVRRKGNVAEGEKGKGKGTGRTKKTRRTQKKRPSKKVVVQTTPTGGRWVASSKELTEASHGNVD